MSCREADRVRRLLVGALSTRETLTVMDHTRVCASCRELLASIPQARGAAAPAEEETEAGSHPTSPPVHRPRLRVVDDFERPASAPRRKSRGGLRILVLGLVVVGAFGIRLWSGNEGRTATPRTVSTEDLAIDAELVAGRPALLAPSGILEHRPRAVRVLLPEGAEEVHVSITRSRGEPWRTTHRADDPDSDFETIDRGELRVVEALVPFPSAEELPLTRGVTHVLWIATADGSAARPARFVLSSDG